jgi:RNA polymerase sigma-70 factor, ECF subfamily
VERAVFLLREVFDYSYEDIAAIVDKTETNCRQIFARARKHIDAQQPRYEASTEKGEALLQSFLAAAHDGDFDQLVDLLAADVALGGDGGGKANAISRPLYGREQVAAFVVGLFQRNKQRGATVEPALVNSGPGMVMRDRGGLIVSVLSLEVLDGVIQAVRAVLNPDKLQHLGAVSDGARIRLHGENSTPNPPE